MAAYVRAIGDVTFVKPTQMLPTKRKPARFTLEELQFYVRGYVQRIGLPLGGALYVNEEARLSPLFPLNERATEDLREAFGFIAELYGDVVILDPYEEQAFARG